MNIPPANRTQSAAFLIGVCTAFCLAFGPAGHFLHFKPASDKNTILLDSRVNPNEANVASLIRLPGIGRTRAEAIVSYRENFRTTESDKRAFKCCEDLQNIHGIGPKISQDIAEWLKFE